MTKRIKSIVLLCICCLTLLLSFVLIVPQTQKQAEQPTYAVTDGKKVTLRTYSYAFADPYEFSYADFFTTILSNNGISKSNISQIKFISDSDAGIYYKYEKDGQKYILTISSYRALKYTGNFSDIKGFFQGNTYLTNVEISNLGFTSDNLDCSYLFQNCTNLTSVTCSLSFAYKVSYLFSGATKLQEITVSGLGNITDASYMFNGASGLTKVSFNSSFEKSFNASHMFDGCKKLQTVGGLNGLNNATSVEYMYNNCADLCVQDKTSTFSFTFDSSNLTSLNYMFNGCKSLSGVDFSGNFRATNVTTMQNMFNGCSNLESVNIQYLTPNKNLTNLSNMFNGCSKLTSFDYSNLKVTSSTTMTNMNNGCKIDAEFTFPDNWPFTSTYTLQIYKDGTGNSSVKEKLDLTNCKSVFKDSTQRAYLNTNERRDNINNFIHQKIHNNYSFYGIYTDGTTSNAKLYTSEHVIGSNSMFIFNDGLNFYWQSRINNSDTYYFYNQKTSNDYYSSWANEFWSYLKINVEKLGNYSSCTFNLKTNTTLNITVGDSTHYFCGTIDGDGHTVTTATCVMFNKLKDATIKNVRLINDRFTYNAENTTFENCSVERSSPITFTNTTSINVGGFADNFYGTMKNCESKFQSNFSLSSDDEAYQGGFVGKCTGNSTFENCMFNGKLSATGTADVFLQAGIVATATDGAWEQSGDDYNLKLTIKNCYVNMDNISSSVSLNGSANQQTFEGQTYYHDKKFISAKQALFAGSIISCDFEKDEYLASATHYTGYKLAIAKNTNYTYYLWNWVDWLGGRGNSNYKYYKIGNYYTNCYKYTTSGGVEAIS